MPKKSGIPIGHRRAFNQVLVSGALPPPQTRLTPGQWVKTLRVVYHMTQAQLARRSGVRQSYITLIERGQLNPGMAALRKLFDASFCELIILPVPRRRPGDVFAELAMEALGARAGRRPNLPRGKWARPSRRWS